MQITLQAAQKRQGAAHKAEESKKAKYREHSHESNAIFVAYCHGELRRFGDEALDWFRVLKAFADKNTYLASNTPDLIDQLKDSVACIVQRHNARMVLESRIQSERRIERASK